MTKDEKIPFMIEWWNKSQNLTVSTNIHRDNIVEIVKQSSTSLRDGCNWFFYTLERYDVPIMIFSAGIGNIVQEFIVQHCGNYKNMKIVSNFMKFNSLTNRICGFQGKLIHSFNKNESVLLDTDYERLIVNRNNVLLIGDSLGKFQNFFR
jgi:HAD superfamily hydrolase (TIGR01544 family)